MSNNETYYCLSKLFGFKNNLNNLCLQIHSLTTVEHKNSTTINHQNIDTGTISNKTINKKPTTEIHKIIDNLKTCLLEVIQLFDEIDHCDKKKTAQRLYMILPHFYQDKNKEDYIKLYKALKSFSESIPTEENNVNTASLGRLMNRVKMGYFPTDLDHVRLMKEAITFPTNTAVNILDPCCGCGIALSEFVSGFAKEPTFHESDGRNNHNTSHELQRPGISTYGIEIDEHRGNDALMRIDRVGFGSFFHSKISHGAFHCIFLNPPYLSVLSENGGNIRYEKSFLAGSIPHLMYGGLLIYIIPYYRATEDVCKVLADNFTDIHAYRFMEPEFCKFKQVAIFAVRKKRSENRQDTINLAHKFLLPENIPSLNNIEQGKYKLPGTIKKVDIFKGAVFNITELAAQLQRSKSTDILFDASRLEDMPKHPPLPLSIGQIGLIGSTGMINGLVGCDTPHIVKGRIVKHNKSSFIKDNTDIKKGKEEIREIVANRIIFNVLTPSGYKSLM